MERTAGGTLIVDPGLTRVRFRHVASFPACTFQGSSPLEPDPDQARAYVSALNAALVVTNHIHMP